MMDSRPFLEPLGFSTFSRGKVRDIYDLGEHLLIVATDRISAFDVVLPTGIPDKGRVLTQLSAFWFEETASIVPNHFVRFVDQIDIPQAPMKLPQELVGRSMVVRKARPLLVECIVRGYTVLNSAGWKEYHESGSICGIRLPKGLQEAQELAEPIFTPTTKAEQGHDENITFGQVVDSIGAFPAHLMTRYSLAVYRYGCDYARQRGIIIADTKFEFGQLDSTVIMIDECLTPDSSRFWPAEQYEAGCSQPSFDKQYVRDYLTQIGWDRTPPAPELPVQVAERTGEKYREAFERLTGGELIT
ncbi:MAG: phosphoribosylaminoimidazolesuccinocarboxamide synthase [bacterium]|nr:phosphoribosylaminoimidazolesuccinocarboxamide synthase [bacterium]